MSRLAIMALLATVMSAGVSGSTLTGASDNSLDNFSDTAPDHAPENSSENAVDGLLKQWRAEAQRPFSASAGAAAWTRQFQGRSCADCHTDVVSAWGRHEKTGKRIEPLAPSVNPERLTEVAKINKWLRRNCKWTYSRECTVQEKGDILLWLREQ
ncbi:MAG: DUF1924 domain-containing protein [Proteobacteria bacterium]|jgi:hypothetical protein|nr:DUF1924 domain-containing protein [Pseudomonadota bacterium]MDA1300566.1 DUF1924 domain-containing protein [Pseudomonadota bacterium]